jgi:hypothetical protein
VLATHVPRPRLIEGFVLERRQERQTIERVSEWNCSTLGVNLAASLLASAVSANSTSPEIKWRGGVPPTWRESARTAPCQSIADHLDSSSKMAARHMGHPIFAEEFIVIKNDKI